MDLFAITTTWLQGNLTTAIGVMIFVAVASLTLGFASIVSRGTMLHRRAHQPYLVGNADVLKDRRALDHRDTMNAARMLSRAAARFTPGESKESGGVRHDLRVAGFLSPQAIGIFYFVRFMMGLGLPVVLLIVYPFVAPEAPFAVTMALAVAAAVLGFYLPNAWLSRRIRVVRESHRQGFPEM
ncbi:MAG: hypothetical protein ACOC71_04910, partial [Hyphomicrobiales bacterium]